MHWKDSVIGILVVVALVGLVAAPSLGGGAAPGTGADVQTQPSSAACDYAELYNETITSVALIRQEQGQGSAFVYDSFDNGTSYVVTNQHVLGESSSVEVSFRRGETRSGTVVGTAETVDLGVVRVDETPGYVSALPVAETNPQPGVKVAALGSPFGLRGSITHGIVSSTDRAVPTEQGVPIPDVIQTDAPINPGNSGGPLVTCDGDVVGVNTAGIPAARAENIGFAISASLVEQVVPRLVETGEYDVAYLGVDAAEVDPAIVRANDLNVSQGVVIVETAEGGPADGALRSADRSATVDGRQVPVGGDVIVAADGDPVRTLEDLASLLVVESSPGDEVTFTVLRDGERRTVTVTLGERPSPGTA